MVKRVLPFLLLLISVPLAAQPSDPVISGITPVAGPVTGGTEVVISGANFETRIQCLLPCPTTVRFGERTVVPHQITDTRIAVTTPAHDAGTVDVVVTTGEGRTGRATGAFTFGATFASWETVLLPIYIDGKTPGWGGSSWATELWVRNEGSAPVSIAPWPCPPDTPCPAVFPLTKELPPGEVLRNLGVFFRPPSPIPGRLVYFSPSADTLSTQLRVGNTAALALGTDWGTELRVVRQRELLTGPTTLLNVPAIATRHTLRIYEVANQAADFRVRFFANTTGMLSNPLREIIVTATSTEGGPFRMHPAYAQVDQFPAPVLVTLPEGLTELGLHIEITPLTAGSRYWAMASVTNGAHQVLTVSPQ